MAWTAKNSAAAEIDRRDKPYLTQAMRDTLTREILPRYETTLACTLPALHMVQHAHGWIPPQAMTEIARFLKIKPAEVLDTASFYEEYALSPQGRHRIAICRSIACEFCGHEMVTQAVKDALGIDVGETTDDGAFTLIELECIGSCGTAPAMLVDETLHENVMPERIGRILDDARGASSEPLAQADGPPPRP